jgi:hypothetical protein
MAHEVRRSVNYSSRLAFAFLSAALAGGLASSAFAQGQPARSEGWVVIPVEEYRALRLRAFPPERPPEPPPVDATVTRVEYDLRAATESATGQVRIMVDVLKEGWVRVNIPPGLIVRRVLLEGRSVPLIDEPSPHVLLSKSGRAMLALDVTVPLVTSSGTETLTLPGSPGAVSRLSLGVPRADIDVSVTGGLLTERPQASEGRWVAYGRPGQTLTASWKRRVQDVRAGQPLRVRGEVAQLVGLGEQATSVSARVRLEIVEGLAASIAVEIPDGVSINRVSGKSVADWTMQRGNLLVSFLEPVASTAEFTFSGEARLPREGAVTVPLVRLPSAERETGGVAVEVLGPGEIQERTPRGLDPSDPSEVGGPVAERESPSILAFRYRPQNGRVPRNLTVAVARYTPQAVLIANVDEARHDALISEDGKVLVRTRYAVRNNQRAFLAATLPRDAVLWSAAVAGRPTRPGVSPSGALLVPLEKASAGGDTPAFPVEILYVYRTSPWDKEGLQHITLPAIDLPVSRTGVVVHHSPRFRVSAEPGAFRADTDTGPFTPALTTDLEQPNRLRAEADAVLARDGLVAQFMKQTAGRITTGPAPVRLPFPEFGPTLFLISELTAELQHPSIELSYERESRW